MKTLINWKVYLILLAASVVAGVALLPWVMETQTMAGASPLFSQLLTQQMVQGVPFFAVLIFLGMLLAKRIGLGAPILDALTSGEPTSGLARRALPLGAALGVFVGLAIIGLAMALQPLLVRELGSKADALSLTGPQPSAWSGLLASFSAGVNEEIQLRLFLMTLLAWLGSFLSRTAERKPTNVVFWIANVLAAVIFGIGHFSSVAMFVPLTAMVVVRTLVLNGIGGIVFGWLYKTRGIESAMVAHFSADIVLHVLLVML